MKERKDIDRLFQEQFKDYEVLPDARVWTKIETSLKKKKKRRVVPIWWQLGGVAAALILLFSIGFNQFTGSDPSIPKPPSQEQKTVEVDNTSNSLPASNSQTDINTTDNAISDLNQDSNLANKPNTKGQNNTERSNKTKATPANTEKSNSALQLSTQNTSVAKAETEASANQNIKSSSSKEITENPRPSKFDTSIAKNTVEESIDKTINEKEKESIEEAIANAEKLQEIAESKNEERWSIAPNIAPVYFNSLGEGSTIGSQFNENNQGSDVTMSYGIAGSYKVGKRLKVRAGINRVNFNYSTNNVLGFASSEIASNSNAVGISTINLNSNARSLTLMSSSTMNRSSAPETLKAQPTGQIQQQFGFVEVPLALEYRVVDKKLGVNLVGGFSTFFLNENEISAVFGGTSTVIGEANNLNSTSYSANFGIGLDYGITKQLNLMLEPTFKYQINTFNNTFGDFQPFFIGVYTGLSFKF